MQTVITAWYDLQKRTLVLENLSDVYYYMVHATDLEERRKWAVMYTNLLIDKHSCQNKHKLEAANTNALPSSPRLDD